MEKSVEFVPDRVVFFLYFDFSSRKFIFSKMCSFVSNHGWWWWGIQAFMKRSTGSNMLITMDHLVKIANPFYKTLDKKMKIDPKNLKLEN